VSSFLASGTTGCDDALEAAVSRISLEPSVSSVSWNVVEPNAPLAATAEFPELPHQAVARSHAEGVNPTAASLVSIRNVRVSCR
jgi:hypothetical protein